MWTTQHVIAKLEELWMQSRLTAGEQHDRQFTFRGNEQIDGAFELIHRHRIALLVADDADGAGQIADVVDLEYRRTSVLQVIFTQAAIFRTAMFDFSSETIRHGAWLCVGERLYVVLGVARDLDFKEAVPRTFL